MQKLFICSVIIHLFYIPLSYSQITTYSNKVFISNKALSIIGHENGFIRIFISPSPSDKKPSESTLFISPRYDGVYKYNQIPWCVDASNMVTILEMFSADGVHTSSNFWRFSHDDISYNHRIDRRMMNYVGSYSTPLSHYLLKYVGPINTELQNLYFDITCPNPDIIRLFIYVKPLKELQTWSCDLTQDFSSQLDTAMSDVYKRYWKNEANYTTEIDGCFMAFTKAGEDYILLQDGTLLKLKENLERIKQLKGNLKDLIIVEDKDEHKTYYVQKSQFEQDGALNLGRLLEIEKTPVFPD